jgi:Flp pilus assembly protein TadG
MLVLPILLAGVINFGLAFLNWIAMRDAAQEGAAYGSYAPTDEQGIIARARETLEGTQAGDATITVVVTQACSSNPIRVDVDADFPVLVPFLNALTPPTLHASATDTILRPKCP